ncbi:IS5/IS1182 family transposase, partial [Methylobacterium sp. E-041]|nr:IS5/IS1182 family transposase [Methylobacterium sp. E-041]MCJ2108525.1 IS5/IS1182 family transposase [Methylobacterium sp. E-041]
NCCRRLTKDWECQSRKALAFLDWVSVRPLIRKLCQNANDSG